MAFKGSISISTEPELDREIKRICTLFQKKETEETWEQFDLALKNVSKWTKEGATSMGNFIPAIKNLKEPIVKSLLTERSRLSGTTTDLLEQLAIHLKRSYEPLNDGFLPHIMKLFTRSNKLFVGRSIKCVSVIIQHAKIPRAIPQFCKAISKPDPNKQMRMGAAQCLTSSIEFNATSDLEHHLEIIENAIRVGAMDPAPEVREVVRKCFEMYKKQLPEPSIIFISSLPANIRKYLKIAGKGESSLRVGNIPPTHRPSLSAKSSSYGDVRRLAISKNAVPGKALHRAHSHPPSETKSLLEAPVPKRQASYHIPNGSSKPPATKRLRTDQSRLARPVISQTAHSETAMDGLNVTTDSTPPIRQGSPSGVTETTPPPSLETPIGDLSLVKNEDGNKKHEEQQSSSQPISNTPSIPVRAPSSFRRSRSSLLSSGRRSLGDPVRPVKSYQLGHGKLLSCSGWFSLHDRILTEDLCRSKRCYHTSSVVR
ncbi:clasp N terminal-domain-containing protein [Umbelopsis sp. AD052]|nr:clasp N terminal-domain-containing protein [Umbelopsis sp. AD052]